MFVSLILMISLAIPSTSLQIPVEVLILISYLLSSSLARTSCVLQLHNRRIQYWPQCCSLACRFPYKSQCIKISAFFPQLKKGKGVCRKSHKLNLNRCNVDFPEHVENLSFKKWQTRKKSGLISVSSGEILIVVKYETTV